MASLGTVTTIYRRGEQPLVFYGEGDYQRFQIQEAEETWNRWTSAERLLWWLTTVCCSSTRQPVFGPWPSLIGRPGLIPGTRIPFEHHHLV